MTTLYTILIPILTITAGWGVSYWIYLKQKRKEMIVNNLIQSCKAIAHNCQKKKPSHLEIENALDELQIIASKNIIKICNETIRKNDNDYNNLLNALRDELRQELRLEKVTDKFLFLRYD